MKAQLESLVSKMLDGRIIYAEAVREVRKAFICVALEDNHGNQCKTASALGMHRNTLARALAELGIAGKRRPPQNVEIPLARWRQQS
jgi:Fis family transcriptional regulator, factor for inversion stimulation protein